jgi:hypothetical protein
MDRTPHLAISFAQFIRHHTQPHSITISPVHFTTSPLRYLTFIVLLLLVASCSAPDVTHEESSISSIDPATHEMSIWIGHVEQKVEGDESGQQLAAYQIGDVVLYDCRHDQDSKLHHPFITAHHSSTYRDAIAEVVDRTPFMMIDDSLYKLDRAPNTRIDPAALKQGDSVNYVCQHNMLAKSHHLLLLDN